MDVHVTDGRHGRFYYFGEDEFVGLSLARYGEYSEEEVIVLQKVLRPGDTAIDVGANIGALTVPMAKLVGPTGRVIAYEPNADNAELLHSNLANNDADFVEVRESAASAAYGRLKTTPLDALGHHNFGRVEVGQGSIRVPCEPIDALNLQALKFIKIDAEGHELQVIRGAQATIRRCRPILYVENDREEKAAELIATIVDLGYRLYWHRPPLFNPHNFRGEQKNVFGRIVSLMMVCVPEERGIEVMNVEEVGDVRDDDRMFEREIERYSRYVERSPDDLMARLVVAHCTNLMQRDPYPLIEENLRRDPQHQPTIAIKGMLDLQRGNYVDGWHGYEQRFGQKHARLFGGHRKHAVPKWDGQPTDQVVLIWAEQGFGDMIMFARFWAWVVARAPNAILEVSPELYELFQLSDVKPRYSPLYRLGRTLPRYDLHCSLPSTAAVLHAEKEMIAIDGPYLTAEPALVKNWRARGHPKIGLCQSGSPRSERPMTRDIPLETLEPLARRFGPFLNLVQHGQFESFADTAAAISALDLVITVDTSIAHLAGALAVPTWLLLSFDPDWRWGLKGSRTVWYPSMTIFRQPRLRDWPSVVAEVERALTTFIAEHDTKAA